MIALFNFNIVVDNLNGIPQAANERAQDKQTDISPMNWVGAQVKAPLRRAEIVEARGLATAGLVNGAQRFMRSKVLLI